LDLLLKYLIEILSNRKLLNFKMNGTEFNLMFFQANDMINFFKKKYLYKNYHIMKKGPIFQNFAEFLDDESLLEIKYTCRKFKQKIESAHDLNNRAIKAELKKVKEKLVILNKIKTYILDNF